MSANKNILTANEMQFLAHTWQCFTQEPKIDFQKLAEISGHTFLTTRFKLGQIKKKLKGGAIDASTNAPKTKTTANGKNVNGKRACPNHDDDDDEEESTPKKTKKANTGTRRSPKKQQPKKLQDGEDDDILATLKEEVIEDEFGELEGFEF